MLRTLSLLALASAATPVHAARATLSPPKPLSATAARDAAVREAAEAWLRTEHLPLVSAHALSALSLPGTYERRAPVESYGVSVLHSGDSVARYKLTATVTRWTSRATGDGTVERHTVKTKTKYGRAKAVARLEGYCRGHHDGKGANWQWRLEGPVQKTFAGWSWSGIVYWYSQTCVVSRDTTDCRKDSGHPYADCDYVAREDTLSSIIVVACSSRQEAPAWSCHTASARCVWNQLLPSSSCGDLASDGALEPIEAALAANAPDDAVACVAPADCASGLCQQGRCEPPPDPVPPSRDVCASSCPEGPSAVCQPLRAQVFREDYDAGANGTFDGATTHIYDSSGRRHTVSVDDNSDGHPERVTTYFYDGDAITGFDVDADNDGSIDERTRLTYEAGLLVATDVETADGDTARSRHEYQDGVRVRSTRVVTGGGATSVTTETTYSYYADGSLSHQTTTTLAGELVSESISQYRHGLVSSASWAFERGGQWHVVMFVNDYFPDGSPWHRTAYSDAGAVLWRVTYRYGCEER